MRCRLVCRAWYCTARLPPFLLTGESNLSLRFTRRNAFEEFARLIGVRGNRSYFRFSELALTLVDDPTHRFVHLWALQVPEYFLSGLRVLALAELNWTTTRPHARFLRRLSHCVTLVQLTLSGCRFRNASVPRNVFNSLPSLEAIWLWDTRFDDLPTSLSLIPPTIAHQSLKYIRIRSTSGNDLADSFGSVHSQNLLSLCIQYQNITTLGLDLRYVSPSHLQRVLRHYHGLSELWLNNAFDPTLELEGGLPFDEADLGGQHTEQHLRTMSVFTLQDTSTVCALHILRLITPYISRNLYELTIELVDRPSAALLRSVTRVLELTGPGLTRMKWTNEKGNGKRLLHSDRG
ncbi:hypothetical protein EVJ58_g10829 [Rhodofomes roseus]|uniref:F-box domain-containing protein n=1 Tax=Rhodofomes roseus TaxID=34475 RepID=A0A4Y9XME4_9APHY|nr:hypothetical protein EVJ58_g10829 [Rhodofomes roseus]